VYDFLGKKAVSEVTAMGSVCNSRKEVREHFVGARCYCAVLVTYDAVYRNPQVIYEHKL